MGLCNHEMTSSKKGTIYLIPSPLAPDTLHEVVVPLVIDLIQEIDFYLVENIRTSRRFISSLNIEKSIDSMNFEVVDKNSQEVDIASFARPLFEGKDVGVLSEAGCPGIADPGALIVSYAHKNNIKVVPIDGPSSIFMALMASGFNGQNFAFKGYLPIDASLRIKSIREIEKLSSKETQIFMETPYRNMRLFETMLKVCNNNTLLSVASNITATDEFIKTLSIRQWKNQSIDLHKKPTIFILGIP